MTVTITPRLLQWPMLHRHGLAQVLLILLARADASGRIATDADYICKVTMLSHTTVQAIIRDLELYHVIRTDEFAVMWLVSLPDGINDSARFDRADMVPDVLVGKDNGRKTEKKDTRFVKPTEKEVQEYILQKGYHFTAEEFIAHYESNGWKVGRNPMKKWQSACVTFERTWKRDQERYQQRLNTQPYAKLNNYQQQQLAARQAYVNATAQANVCDDDTADELLLPGM